MTWFRIHFTDTNGQDGFILVEASPKQEREVFNAALCKVAKRGGTDPWIEEVIIEPTRSWKQH